MRHHLVFNLVPLLTGGNAQVLVIILFQCLIVQGFAGKLLCIENLQYTAGFLGLPKKATTRELAEAAERVCSVPWSEMLKRYTSYEPEHLLNYCFGSASRLP